MCSLRSFRFPWPRHWRRAANRFICNNARHVMPAAGYAQLTIPCSKPIRHRIDMWTQNSATAYNNYGAGHFLKLSHFVKQNGYVNVPLEGLWLRGPYLHNGSVPTLADLLEDPAQRPK